MQRDRLESSARTHLEAYIRDMRSSMEGDKGGGSHGRWYTASRSASERWKAYVKSRQSKCLPVIGSQALFKKLWAKHTEIREYSSLSHAKCDVCGKLESHFDRLDNSEQDAETARERQALTEAMAVHSESMGNALTDRERFCFAGGAQTGTSRGTSVF
eukprot:6178723-Pleurochrysis_carterae.AAC.1